MLNENVTEWEGGVSKNLEIHVSLKLFAILYDNYNIKVAVFKNEIHKILIKLCGWVNLLSENP